MPEVTQGAVVTPNAGLMQAFEAQLRNRFGAALEAIVVYGSAMRGKRDTIWDLYVLLDNYGAVKPWPAALGNRLLAPNVYYLETEHGGQLLAAKYATVTLQAFERAMAARYDLYFWARFAQPCHVFAQRSDATRVRIEAATQRAGERMLETVVPLMEGQFSAAELWTRAFTLSYGCELRSEAPSRAGELYLAYRHHLDRIIETRATALGLQREDNDCFSGGARPAAAARRQWRVRKLWGKFLAGGRLLKAAFTFNDALDYVMWKVERHSGVRVEATPLQRRFPLLFGWPVIWRLYRRGGFR